MPTNKKLISVTDITAWLYCPRKLYISKVKKIQQPLTPEMLTGKIKHNALDIFSKREKELVINLKPKTEKLDLVLIYQNFLDEIIDFLNNENIKLIEGFRLNKEDIKKKIKETFNEDIRLRVHNIYPKLVQGLSGEELWNNLETLYVSEISLESVSLGLKGRVDRIGILKSNNSILPYELKSREQKIFPSDEIQLTAYAMLLEDNYKQIVSKGIVESGTLKKEVLITDENKALVLEIAEKIRAIENEIPPIQSNFNKCSKCPFNEICFQIS